jgi:hypothetical protein
MPRGRPRLFVALGDDIAAFLMDPMMKSIGAELFTPAPTGEFGVAFKRLSAKDAGLKESWFRDAIFMNPELVIGACRSGGIVVDVEHWYPWAKEYGIPDTGSIDVLLLSSQGRIGIVETKLAFNPERRREVVAQILDYAVALQEVSFSDLPPLSAAKAARTPTEHDLQDALAAGRFLLIVAGDELEPRAIRLAEEVLAGHLTSEWDLAMVDLNLYEAAAGGQRLLVPELRGKLIHEVRQVVRVVVEGEQPKAKIQVERLPDPSRSDRIVWTDDAFFTALATAEVNPAFRELVMQLVQMTQRHLGTSIGFGTGKLGSVTLRRAGASVLSLFLDGRAETKPRDYIVRALGVAGAASFSAAIEQLWGKDFVDGWKRSTADQVLRHGPALLLALEDSLRAADSAAPPIATV